MTVFDDDQDMRPQGSQDDELVLTGRAVPGDDALVDLLTSLRTMADVPAPAPTPALAALLRGGLPPRAVVVPLPVRIGRTVRRRAGAAGRWVAGLGLAGKVVLGAGVALAGVTGAATIPAVPDVVQRPAQTVLTDVGRVFGGGDAAPVPAPSTSTARPSDDGATKHSAGPGGGASESGEQSGTDGRGTTGGAGSAGRHDDAEPSGRSGVGGVREQGPSGGPGQPSTGHGSAGEGSVGEGSTGPGSAGEGATAPGPAGQRSPEHGSSPEQGQATGSDAGRNANSMPARSPQPSSSATPRADAGPTRSSSGR